MSDLPELEIKEKGSTEAIKAGIAVVGKSISAMVVLASEIAVIAVIGGLVGSYITSKTVVSDCQRVNLAKVSDSYIKCTVVEPIKDAATQPPR
jgi:uncharacterized membrane protein